MSRVAGREIFRFGLLRDEDTLSTMEPDNLDVNSRRKNNAIKKVRILEIRENRCIRFNLNDGGWSIRYTGSTALLIMTSQLTILYF